MMLKLYRCLLVLSVTLLTPITFIHAQAPIITERIPATGSSNVSRDQVFTLVFDRNIKRGSGSIYIFRYSNDRIERTINVSNATISESFPNQLSFTPTESLQGNTLFYVTMDAGAITSTDDVAYPGFNEKNFWTFTTILIPGEVTIVSESFPNTFNKGSSLNVSISLDHPDRLSEVYFFSRGISLPSTAEGNSIDVLVNPNSNTIEYTIEASQLTDEIGVEYFFEFIDQEQRIKFSTTAKAYVTRAEPLPGLTFGSQVSNYQLIAVPLNLTNNNVSDAFSTLMPYDKTKWRLFDYANNDNREYPGFSTIVPGKGYWLIVKDNIILNPGVGTAVEVDQTSPFNINLTQGWNLIGNPYSFPISWAEVLAASGNPPGVDPAVQIFTTGGLSNGTVIAPYRGAFVFSSTPTTISIPATQNSSLGGRKSDQKNVENSIDSDKWEVKLALKTDELTNELGGIGMHPEATLLGKDEFDRVSFPFLDGFNFFELAYPHPELSADFSKEVVPTQSNFIWDFDVKREQSDKALTLQWDNSFFGSNNKELWLIDPSAFLAINMREATQFTIQPTSKKLKFVFGDRNFVEELFDKEMPQLGNPFPNPASEQVTIPVRIPAIHDGLPVRINVFNSQGAAVETILDQRLSAGSYDLVWRPANASGLYLIQITIGVYPPKTVKVLVSR